VPSSDFARKLRQIYNRYTGKTNVLTGKYGPSAQELKGGHSMVLTNFVSFCLLQRMFNKHSLNISCDIHVPATYTHQPITTPMGPQTMVVPI
jgi:hypothetical protein